MDTLDGRHFRCSVEVLRNRGSVEWVVRPLHMRCAFWAHDKSVLPALAIRLNQIVNVSTEIVRHKSTFADMMHSLLSYVLVFEEAYAESLFYMRIMYSTSRKL